MTWLIIPIAAFLRSIFGWLENSCRDEKIELFEWRKLGETTIRMLLPILVLIFAFNVDEKTATGIGILFDLIIVKIYNSLKEKKSVSKK